MVRFTLIRAGLRLWEDSAFFCFTYIEMWPYKFSKLLDCEPQSFLSSALKMQKTSAMSCPVLRLPALYSFINRQLPKARTNNTVLTATPLSNRSLFPKSGNTDRFYSNFYINSSAFHAVHRIPRQHLSHGKHSQAAEGFQVTVCYLICAQLPNNKCWLLFPKNSYPMLPHHSTSVQDLQMPSGVKMVDQSDEYKNEQWQDDF